MLKIIVVLILAGTWISHTAYAKECDNFCTIVKENSRLKRYEEKNFLVNPIMTRNQYTGIADFNEGIHVKCLEIPVIACDEQIFCLGCCNVSENKTYPNYRTKIEKEYRCGNNECCRDIDLKHNGIERGCELFRV